MPASGGKIIETGDYTTKCSHRAVKMTVGERDRLIKIWTAAIEQKRLLPSHGYKKAVQLFYAQCEIATGIFAMFSRGDHGHPSGNLLRVY